MVRIKNRGRERGEQPPPLEEIDVSPEEVELSDFLDGLGPQGISEVSLYRLLPSGKQRFITSGPPSQFSEQYVQAQFGEGDYLARAKLNGRWYKSKSLSVEATPGAASLAPRVMPNHDAELERLKAQIESQRLEMERDRQAREQRNHELQLKMLEALGGRGNQAVGPSLTELIASVEALRNLAGNGGGLAGFKEVLEIADRINTLRGDGKDEDSWLGVLKSVAPELGQLVTQILLTRNGSPDRVAQSVAVRSAEAKPAEGTLSDTASLPTAYDQVAGQLRGLLDRLQSQIKAGLDVAMAVETLLALETSGDPIARLVLSAVEKSLTFESWLTWLRSQVGAGTVIEEETVTFLSKVFEAVKALPSDYPEAEGQ